MKSKTTAQVRGKAEDERHRYGRHYTPLEVARLLAAFAVRSAGALVLDPSCGDGRLLEEALKLKRELASQRSSGAPLSVDLFGVEHSEPAAQIARRTGARVAAADFFDVEPGQILNPSTSSRAQDASAPRSLPREFDAVVGNPPYIRQEVIGSRDKRRIEARLKRDREASPGVFWPPWSGRSDIYVYFFAHSIRFLKEGGRLVFLTASSWLDSGYGAALREFLLKNFRVIAVIESAAESFFADASINTCITVLERASDSREREENSIRFVHFNRTLREICEEETEANATLKLANDIERYQKSTTNNTYRIRVIAQPELAGTVPRDQQIQHRAPTERGWGKYLRAADVFFQVIERGSSKLQSLATMAKVRFGVKTGANEFFYVSDAESEGKKGRAREGKVTSREGSNGLRALREVASVRRGITTGANEFFYLRAASANRSRAIRHKSLTSAVESRFLSPVVFSLKEIPGILLDRVEPRRMLFNCSLAPQEIAGTGALAYIKSGERAGYHVRPTCSSREPWYSVARGLKPAPLIFPSKVGERWLVALNGARVFEDKKLYGVFPARGVSAEVLAALLNSTWARYFAEVTCRQMTGAQAIADIDVSVAEQIMLPDPRDLSSTMKKRLAAALAVLGRRSVGSIFEEVQRSDRRRLDAMTLEAIGFNEKSAREAVLDELYKAVTELVRARLSKRALSFHD